MSAPQKTLELLAPAKNAAIGMAAIMHGADAVYIGGPAFGARANATNSLSDIADLVRFAHRFNARVLIAFNTLLYDNELEDARRLAWQMYECGADALIIQDMGLLQLDLPPLELHASTQCDIRDAAKARFLQDVGFSQMVLARELNLDEIRAIAAHTDATLEYFVHGALCVGYSGLCNLSVARCGRSANRGECAQPCRLPYTLLDENGTVVAKDRHLLSLKDNDQSANLRQLIDAGIRSFKIEGRLKDLDYVKNITAHYRRLLDEIMAQDTTLSASSSGTTQLFFVPQPQKTFNRGTSEYFIHGRAPDAETITAFDSPKFVGEACATLHAVEGATLHIKTLAQLNNGDGLSAFNAQGELIGLRINRADPCADGYRLNVNPNDARLFANLPAATRLYRNHDQAFLAQLAKKSADRRIGLTLALRETVDGFALHATDECGISAMQAISCAKEITQDAARGAKNLRDSLGKLGQTIFRLDRFNWQTHSALFTNQTPFIPASQLNALRRATIDALEHARLAAYRRPPRRAACTPAAQYPQRELDYLGNVLNQQAEAFYREHGVQAISPAYESRVGTKKAAANTVLMFAKHCLRYSFGRCPKQHKGIRPEPMRLVQEQQSYSVHFDCKKCEMTIVQA